MDFTLTEEQQLLADGLRKFLASRYDLSTSRTAAATGSGMQQEIWRSFADELGLLDVLLPESVGGAGGGAEELMIITEELGRALVIEPYVGTAVIAAGLLDRSQSPAAEPLLQAIGEGTAVVALAAGEASAGDNWQTVTTTARRFGDGWILDGAKSVVLDAPLATHLLVTARTSGSPGDADGISLFLVNPKAAGLTVNNYRTIDDRRGADLVFARVAAEALLGPEGGAWPSLARARDTGAVAVASEAVGAMRTVLHDTVEYAKQRTQFGVPIGSFQVLQHRMVDMMMELEQAAAAVLLAVLHLDADERTRARTTSVAKATVGRAARFVGQNAVQLHGGMGMTEELAIGHYFKRLTAVQYEFGTTDSHRSRYATLTRDV